jgi:MFS family permease
LEHVDQFASKAYRYRLMFVMAMGNFINAFDRASLSIAVPFIMKEFNVDTVAMGMALSAFFWAYVPFNTVVGNLADRFGIKKVLGWSAFLWSAFSALTGLAQNVYHIIAMRFGVGLGESAVLPCNTKIAASNYPSKERGFTIGVYLAGIRLGNAVTPLVMVFLIKSLGWRSAFVITGLASLLWCVMWYFSYKETKVEKKAQIQKVKVPWRLVLRNRMLLCLTAAKFFQDYVMWLFFTWVPGYLVLGRGFDAITMAFYMSVSYAVAGFAQPIIGFFSDWLIRKGFALNSRKILLASLQITASTIIITGFSNHVGIAMFFLVLAISSESVCSAVTFSIISEITPHKVTGSLAGVINSIGAVGGILAPIVTGVIVKVTGSFQLALTLGGIMMLIAAALVLFGMPKLALQTSLDTAS